MKLSVVIPCHNAADTIATQLDALAAQRWSEPWEIVVSDNGSTDATRAIVERYAARLPNVRVVDSSAHKSRSYARNVGVRAAAGELLAFCDADDEVAPGWLAALGDALRTHDFVVGRIEWEKLNPAWAVECCRMNTVGLIPHNYPPFFPFAPTGNLGVRRALHEKVGGFDESLVRLQDADYSWKLQLAGAEPHVVPEAVVHVRLRASRREMLRQMFTRAEYAVLLYKKYLPLGMPRLALRSGVGGWKTLARTFPRAVLSERRRLAWLHELAWRLGRLKGSIKYRVIAL